MGQRLVVDIKKNNETLASIYYHWRAYFCSTIYELAKLSETILEAQKNNKNELEAILTMLETDEEYTRYYDGEKQIRSGGVRETDEDIQAAKELFPNRHIKRENVDRNCGIITFTKEGIEHFHDWEEGHADIHLDTHEICNNVDLDPDPFELETEYETDEDGEQYVANYFSGKVSINGKTCPVDAFDCTCESILELVDFMDKEFEEYRKNLPHT